jgi:hypothetical protein
MRDTNLSIRMHNLADSGHERASELREKANAFDAAVVGYYSEPHTVSVAKLMGAFARARRLWCDITGESLV